MKPTELKELIKIRFQSSIKRPLHVESSPGVGKTQIAAQVAKELGVGFMTIHAPLLQPEDYGFPVISGDRKDVDFVVSKAKFPIEGSDCEDMGIFLIDELPQADASAQKILANLIQEREIHGRKLKPGWYIVSTGNRANDRAGANRLLSHLRNRMTTVDLDASIEDWSMWAIQNGVKPEVISFIRFRPALLNAFNAQQDHNPTPRAWVEGVSATLGVIPFSMEYDTFKGDVGEGAAAEFIAFTKIYRQLPDPEVIIPNPKTANVPSDPATKYALCGALAHKATKANLGAMYTYMERVGAEFVVLFTRDALTRDKSLSEMDVFKNVAVQKLTKIMV